MRCERYYLFPDMDGVALCRHETEDRLANVIAYKFDWWSPWKIAAGGRDPEAQDCKRSLGVRQL